MINWNKVIISEPPVIHHVSENDLIKFIKETAKAENQLPVVDFPRFRCLTQAVGTVIKLHVDLNVVTESSLFVCGQYTRYVLDIISSS